MTDQDEDDRIPLLDDVVRGGRETAGPRPPDRGTLTEAEIEAIAARVVERHTNEMEQAVARAIRTALDSKARRAEAANGGSEQSGENT